MKELQDIDYNTKGISNHLLTECVCIKCNKTFSYKNVKNFMFSRKKNYENKDLWNTCQECWMRIRTYDNIEWIKNNSNAQLIAQNKPEQKIKNAKAVSESWTDERKIKNSIYLKDRWKNDKDFSEKALLNLSWTNGGNRYLEIMKKSIGSGGLKGEYNGIYYDSALELSYILYCVENNIDIERYNLEGIEYLDESHKIRHYIPDFIINKDTIIEIKGLSFYNKDFERINIKLAALKQWTIINNFNYRIIISTDDILTKNYNRARKIHHENKKKNCDKI
jgi:hypothetical protein